MIKENEETIHEAYNDESLKLRINHNVIYKYQGAIYILPTIGKEPWEKIQSIEFIPKMGMIIKGLADNKDEYVILDRS